MSLLKMPYEITTNNIKLKMLIYGSPGSGKSTLALSAPNPVMLDADGGVHRVDQRHRVPTLQVESFQQVLDLLASGELKPFESIIIDTAGKLLDFVNAHIIRLNPKNGQPGGQLSQRGWGERAAVFSALVRSISTMNKHLIFVGHDREEKDGDNKTMRLDVGGGKSGGELAKELDLIGFLEMQGRARTISFAPTDRYYAKNCLGLEDEIKIPILTGGVPNDFLTKIVERYNEKANVEARRLKEYTDLMEQVKVLVDSIVDAETANSVTQEIKKLPVVWDSLIKARSMFASRAKELDLDFDKESKTYRANATEAA